MRPGCWSRRASSTSTPTTTRQAIWSNRLDPSSWNGVTTVMMGNCGVGFAPCKPDERDMLVALMEGVEDIPEVVMTEGLPWNWETFPDFLDRLDERRFDVDIVTQVPHAAIRVYVMGQRGADREPSTEADRKEMARLTVEGIEAGALGFSTSNAIAHKTLAGKPTPTLGFAEEELAVIAEAVGKTGTGWVQIITDFDDPVDGAGQPAARRRPLGPADEPHPGAARGQAWPLEVAARPDRRCQQGWRQAACPDHGPADRHQFRLRDIAQSVLRAGRATRRSRTCPSRSGWHCCARRSCGRRSCPRRPRIRRWRGGSTAGHTIFELGTPPNYEPPPEASMTARAASAGVPVEEFVYDLLLQDGGKTILFRPVTNYVDGNLDACLEMMKHPNTVMGLGDGGAHYSFICDSSTTTYTITHWTRDRTRGEKMPLAWVVKRLSRDPALTIGLEDRGADRARLQGRPQRHRL